MDSLLLIFRIANLFVNILRHILPIGYFVLELLPSTAFVCLAMKAIPSGQKSNHIFSPFSLVRLLNPVILTLVSPKYGGLWIRTRAEPDVRVTAALSTCMASNSSGEAQATILCQPSPACSIPCPHHFEPASNRSRSAWSSWRKTARALSLHARQNLLFAEFQTWRFSALALSLAGLSSGESWYS